VITKDEVKHIAKLARLSVDEREAEAYASQLSSILDYMEQLNKAETEGIEPMITASPINTVYRKDEVKREFSVEEKLANAPEVSGSLVKVPPVVG